MYKKITLDAIGCFCDKCGTRIDTYFNQKPPKDRKPHYCEKCLESSRTCCECGKVIFPPEPVWNCPLNNKYYCKPCAEKAMDHANWCFHRKFYGETKGKEQ